ncbi:MAG: hypothetical protein AMS20_16060 [Gemmatimonas sp. SG8_28]|jgi:hypothetical protein|nr:MAG: hypothetical protein AMS20_16060 [Gemmatimonas sp. SG8_28]
MMTKANNASTTAIQNLLEEKRQIERWLRRLDMASDKTPQAVRDRVRSDYRGRLEAILTELQGYRDDLNASLQQHRDVRDDLAGREQEASERLAEAELRHTVGEYDSSKWSEIRAEILEELVKLREELKVEQAEIGQLEEVLDAIDSSGTAEEAEVEAEAETEVRAEEAPATGVATPEAADDSAPELDLQTDKEQEAAHPERTSDELAFLRSVISGDRSASELTPAQQNEGAEAEPAKPRQVARPSKGTAKKTVKCTDCGTLNLPTEWYCENCGAELTAL